jgi:chitin synthase
MVSNPKTRFANQPPPLRPPPTNGDIPIPTTRRPPQHSNTLRRNKTLTRPERGIAPAPLIAPTAAYSPQVRKAKAKGEKWTVWTIFSYIVTFWAPPFILSSLAGLKDKVSRQAWREKVALCFIALVLGAIIGFLTVGLNRALCPQSSTTDPDTYVRVATTPGLLGVAGRMYDVTRSQRAGAIDFTSISATMSGQDVTSLFQRDVRNYPSCRGLTFTAAQDPPCPIGDGACPVPALLNTTTLRALGFREIGKFAGYDWPQVKELATLKNYFVIDGAVLNFNDYIFAHPQPIPNDTVDKAIRTMLSHPGKDGTRLFYNRKRLIDSVPCLTERYKAGNIDKITPGCVASSLILYAGLIVILGLVVIRFVMACIFNWFISSRLTAPPKNLSRAVVSPAVMPVGANVQMNSKNGTAPWSKGNKKPNLPLPGTGRGVLMKAPRTPSSRGEASPVISLAQIGAELFTVCLITCYSEGEESIRGTVESISRTTYSDARKLMFVVCDGMVTGAGEKRSTPDTCVGLIDVDPRFGEPVPMSYVAVGLGTKKENKALVYAGHYCKFE